MGGDCHQFSNELARQKEIVLGAARVGIAYFWRSLIVWLLWPLEPNNLAFSLEPTERAGLRAIFRWGRCCSVSLRSAN